MYPDAVITGVAGADGLTYAQNKNRGGRSSAKGRDYEVSYGAYRIALAAAKAFQTGGLGADIEFNDQVKCFVDDFITTDPNGRTLAQLKSGGVSWNAGDHPLADDFRLQARLDAACGISAKYQLVVNGEGRRAEMIGARPADLNTVDVVDFPEGLRDLDLIDRLADLAAALLVMSPRPPERVVKEQVWRMLLGTWQCSQGAKTLAELVNTASHGPGAVVAPMLPEYVLPDEAKILLDNVPTLRFNISKNFFAYQALDGVQKGVAEYHCHTPEFEAFVAALIDTKPTDFFEFWAVFKAHV